MLYPLALTRMAVCVPQQVRPSSHSQLVDLLERLDFLCSMLGALIEIPHEKGPARAAAAELVLAEAEARQLSNEARARCVGERGVSLMQHVALLWHGSDQLTTLVEAVSKTELQLKV